MLICGGSAELARTSCFAVLRTQPFCTLPEQMEEPKIIAFSKAWRQID
jgi:hypothetical protein